MELFFQLSHSFWSAILQDSWLFGSPLQRWTIALRSYHPSTIGAICIARIFSGFHHYLVYHSICMSNHLLSRLVVRKVSSRRPTSRKNRKIKFTSFDQSEVQENKIRVVRLIGGTGKKIHVVRSVGESDRTTRLEGRKTYVKGNKIWQCNSNMKCKGNLTLSTENIIIKKNLTAQTAYQML